MCFFLSITILLHIYQRPKKRSIILPINIESREYPMQLLFNEKIAMRIPSIYCLISRIYRAKLGTSLGTELGASDGTSLGVELGTSLGKELGASDGRELGTSDGTALDS
jgi:hypothetical protein